MFSGSSHLADGSNSKSVRQSPVWPRVSKFAYIFVRSAISFHHSSGVELRLAITIVAGGKGAGLSGKLESVFYLFATCSFVLPFLWHLQGYRLGYTYSRGCTAFIGLADPGICPRDLGFRSRSRGFRTGLGHLGTGSGVFRVDFGFPGIGSMFSVIRQLSDLYGRSHKNSSVRMDGR